MSAENSAQINRRRTINEAKEDQILPMVIVGIWSDNCVSGQVFLDGNDSLWVTSAQQGNEPGNWNYFMCDLYLWFFWTTLRSNLKVANNSDS